MREREILTLVYNKLNGYYEGHADWQEYYTEPRDQLSICGAELRGNGRRVRPGGECGESLFPPDEEEAEAEAKAGAGACGDPSTRRWGRDLVEDVFGGWSGGLPGGVTKLPNLVYLMYSLFNFF